MKGIQICQNEGPRPLPSRDNNKIATTKNSLTKFKKNTRHKADMGKGIQFKKKNKDHPILKNEKTLFFISLLISITIAFCKCV